MSTHSCNNLCDLADGWGHVAQKVLCDSYSDKDKREELRARLEERIGKDTELLESL